MDILARLKLRTGETDENLLNDLIESAKNAILTRRFPYQEWPTRLVTRTITTVVQEESDPEENNGEETTEEVTEENTEETETEPTTVTETITVEETYVEPRYEDLQFRIALDLYNKIGAEGENVHTENGISRSYESSWISAELLEEIAPYCGVL